MQFWWNSTLTLFYCYMYYLAQIWWIGASSLVIIEGIIHIQVFLLSCLIYWYSIWTCCIYSCGSNTFHAISRQFRMTLSLPVQLPFHLAPFTNSMYPPFIHNTLNTFLCWCMTFVQPLPIHFQLHMTYFPHCTGHLISLYNSRPIPPYRPCFPLYDHLYWHPIWKHWL